MKKNIVPTPHDRFFRVSMSNPRVAREFFESHLPHTFKMHADLDTLKLQPGSFVDTDLQLQITDVLYSLDWMGKKSYLYTLVEHLRKPDSLMAFRNVKYRISIMDQHLKQTGELPLVFVLVVYNGSSKYPYSTDLFDLFGADKTLAKELFLKPFELIDLSQIPDENLKQRAWSGILELSLKHTREPDLLPFLRDIIHIVKKILNSGDDEYVITVFNYLMMTGEISNLQALRSLIHENLSPEQEEKIMTIAQQFRQEGRQEGIQEGRQKEKIKLAMKLIEENLFDREKIADMVDLPFQLIKNLSHKQTVN